MSRARKLSNRSSQAGMALVMALVFLLILTLLGVTSMGNTTLQEKMAGNQRDKHTAFQAAETGLTAGEVWMGAQGGLQPQVGDASTPTWVMFPATGSQPAWDEASGVWTGANSATLTGMTQVPSQPRYIIEDMGIGPFRPGLPLDMQTLTHNQMYRVTARGVGNTGLAASMVQSTYEMRFLNN